jgi:hypothetical protein
VGLLKIREGRAEREDFSLGTLRLFASALAFSRDFSVGGKPITAN